jgi:hypothetical protein
LGSVSIDLGYARVSIQKLDNFLKVEERGGEAIELIKNFFHEGQVVSCVDGQSMRLVP